MVVMLRGDPATTGAAYCGTALHAYSNFLLFRSFCGILPVMPATADPRYDAIRDALESAAETADPGDALPHLRTAADRLTALIDDTMARALVTGRASLRAVGAGAGLSENAVGPRIARTAMLAPYANESGRVTASGVERARYDHETGRVPEPAPSTESRPPMRFRPRTPRTPPTPRSTT
jgi:hypothetical protein